METINNIVREMRCGMIPKHRHDRELLLKYADRIEKASKALEADRDNWLRQALDEDARANAAICEKSSQVGNAAKMREALDKLLGVFDSGLVEYSDACDHSDTAQIQYVIDKAGEALSVPARNCDRFNNLKGAKIRYCAEVEYVCIWDGVNTEKLINWLFAEAKGEAK